MKNSLKKIIKKTKTPPPSHFHKTCFVGLDLSAWIEDEGEEDDAYQTEDEFMEAYVDDLVTMHRAWHGMV